MQWFTISSDFSITNFFLFVFLFLVFSISFSSFIVSFFTCDFSVYVNFHFCPAGILAAWLACWLDCWHPLVSTLRILCITSHHSIDLPIFSLPANSQPTAIQPARPPAACKRALRLRLRLTSAMFIYSSSTLSKSKQHQNRTIPLWHYEQLQ